VQGVHFPGRFGCTGFVSEQQDLPGRTDGPPATNRITLDHADVTDEWFGHGEEGQHGMRRK
jgi:hypothetical protein